MTLNGVVHRTALLLLFVVGGAGLTWKLSLEHNFSALMPLLLVGLIGSLIVGFLTIAKKEWAAYTAIPYALLEGLMLGGISAFAEMRYPGVVMQAVGITFGTLFCLLAAYRSGLIKATENFKLGVVAATGGIALFAIGSMILRTFGIVLVQGTNALGIGVSLFVTCIAALNVVLDFDFIESGVEARAPRYLEWYAAFGLLVTLVWLYLEILRLLGNTRSRD